MHSCTRLFALFYYIDNKKPLDNQGVVGELEEEHVEELHDISTKFLSIAKTFNCMQSL